MSHRNQANQLGVTYFRPDFILCTLTTRDDQDASDIRSDDYRSDFWSYHQLTISPNSSNIHFWSYHQLTKNGSRLTLCRERHERPAWLGCTT